jgi:uncharacterized protein HemY
VAALTHNNLGVLLFREKKYSEAEEQFRSALSIAPDFEDAQRNLERAVNRQSGTPQP